MKNSQNTQNSDYLTKIPGLLYSVVKTLKTWECIIQWKKDLRENLAKKHVSVEDLWETITVKWDTYWLALKALSDILLEENPHAWSILNTLSSNEVINTPWVEIEWEVNEKSIDKFLWDMSWIQLLELQKKLTQNPDWLIEMRRLLADWIATKLEYKSQFMPKYEWIDRSWETYCIYPKSRSMDTLNHFKEWYGNIEIIEIENWDVVLFNKNNIQTSDQITVSYNNCYCETNGAWLCPCITSELINYNN